MNGRRLAALCMMSALVMAGIALGTALHMSAAAALPRLAPPEVYGQRATGDAVSEVSWAPGVLEAAEMYYPSELPVLEIVYSTPTKQQVLDLAARAGRIVSPQEAAALPDEDPDGDGSRYACDFGQLSVEVRRDGNALFIWHDRDLPAEYFKHPGSCHPPEIAHDHAVAAVEAFLENTALLPQGARMVKVSPHRAEIAGTTPNQDTAPAWSVVYRRFWSGVPEGRVTVTVNGDGRIYSYARRMPNVRLLGYYPVLRPDEAREAIWSPHSAFEPGLNLVCSRPLKAVIKGVRMEYCEDASGAGTIQPVYTLAGTAHDQDGQPVPFSAMVPAVRPEYLEPAEALSATVGP